MRRLVGIEDISERELAGLLSSVHDHLNGKRVARSLERKVICLAFFQPSTRTKISFQRAVLNLGGSYIGFSDIAESRSAYPFNESLDDCLRVLEAHSDAIVLRHSESLCGIGPLNVPLISAGDGIHQHPLQAITDLCALIRRDVDPAAIRMGLVGDLTARVFRSLVKLMLRTGTREFVVFSASATTLPSDVSDAIRAHGGRCSTAASLEELIAAVDVVEVLPYRIPRVGTEPTNPEPGLVVSSDLVKRVNPKAFLLHPGPRSWELCPSTDALENSLFHEQARITCAVKMAALSWATA